MFPLDVRRARTSPFCPKNEPSSLCRRNPYQRRSAVFLYLPGQYKGLMEHKGIAYPYPAAIKGPSLVEVRDIYIYDQLIGGVAHG